MFEQEVGAASVMTILGLSPSCWHSKIGTNWCNWRFRATFGLQGWLVHTMTSSPCLIWIFNKWTGGIKENQENHVPNASGYPKTQRAVSAVRAHGESAVLSRRAEIFPPAVEICRLYCKLWLLEAAVRVSRRERLFPLLLCACENLVC